MPVDPEAKRTGQKLGLGSLLTPAFGPQPVALFVEQFRRGPLAELLEGLALRKAHALGQDGLSFHGDRVKFKSRRSESRPRPFPPSLMNGSRPGEPSWPS